MKAIILLSIAASSFAFAQSVQEYKYIAVPTNFADKQINTYKLSENLAKQLKAKRYVVVSENPAEWPVEIAGKPCQVLKANLLDTGTLFRNRVDLVLKDCNDKVVLESRGNSMIKEFDPGYSDALKLALVKLPASEAITPIATVAEVKTEKAENQEAAMPSGIVLFINNGSTYQKIQTGEKQFILVQQNSSNSYATFVESSRKDMYHVTLNDGKTTMAYIEDGNLVIDMPHGNSYKKEIFSKSN